MILKGIIVVFLLISYVFAGEIGKFAYKATSERFAQGVAEGIDGNLLIEIVNRTNRKLPMMVDSETRLNSTTSFDSEMIYNYTLVNKLASEIDSDAFKSANIAKLTNFYCSTPDTKFFIEHNFLVTKLYYGKNGVHIASITLSPNDCDGITK